MTTLDHVQYPISPAAGPAGARLYELRAPGLEGRFFCGVARRDRALDPDDAEDDCEPLSSASSGEDELHAEVGEGMNQEDSFLASANLCRYVHLALEVV